MKEVQKAYKCDYCSKVSISKYVMQRHEDTCSKNPKNRTYCYECAHSTSKRKKYSYEPFDPRDDLVEDVACKAPYCKHFKMFLVAPKLARASYFHLNDKIEILMPTYDRNACNYFKVQTFSEYLNKQ